MQHPKLIIASGLLLTSLIAGTAVSWQTPVVSGLLNRFQLSGQSEPYTELYFQDHLHLPLQPYAGKYNFAFAVANHNASTQHYPYQVLLTVDGKQSVIDSGSFDLANGNSREVKESFVLKSDATSAEVSVQLTGIGQEIHFWLRKQ